MSFEVTSDSSRLHLPELHSALLRKHACHAPSPEVLAASVANSFNFAVFTAAGQLAAYARVITDTVTFAHLADVFVLDEHRGLGLSKLLVNAILAHPGLRLVPRFTYFDNESRPFFLHSGHPASPLPEPLLAISRTAP